MISSETTALGPNIPTIIVVGAGFSGVAVTWQLLRQLRSPAKLILINRNARIGRGLAYGTPLASHLLNVPAGRMGLDPLDEAGFINYLQKQGLHWKANDFVPRGVYGTYLETALEEVGATAYEGVALTILADTALKITRLNKSQLDTSPKFNVGLAGGQVLKANAVILALGHFPSLPPALNSAITWREAGLILSPWIADRVANIPKGHGILLLGTGLTAFDVLLQLRQQGHTGRITMISRRGQTAQSHRSLEVAPSTGLVPPDAFLGVTSVRVILKKVREMICRAEKGGHDWRDIIGGLRGLSPKLWQQLPDIERRRFLRHLAPYWDTHRHRAAVQIGRAVKADFDAGHTHLEAGRLKDLKLLESQHWEVMYVKRGETDTRTLTAQTVINCTGPSSDISKVADSLISDLHVHGRLVQDALALGLCVDDAYRLLDVDGVVQEDFYYVGPLLKAQYWEATAVPELRTHAAKLAAELVARLNTPIASNEASFPGMLR